MVLAAWDHCLNAEWVSLPTLLLSSQSPLAVQNCRTCGSKGGQTQIHPRPFCKEEKRIDVSVTGKGGKFFQVAGL